MSKELVTTTQQTAIDIARNSICRDLTEQEFRYFWAVAEKKGLDPLSGEIIATKRKARNQNGQYEDRLTIQTGIDGYRHLAERTGEYDGQDEPVFDREPDAKNPYPTWAKVTVYRRITENNETRRIAVTAKVFFAEFAQKNAQGQLIGQWARMPYLMLGKCAEVQAIRKAFPRQVAGLVHDVEMLAEEAPPTQIAAKPVAQAVEALAAPTAPKDWTNAVMAFAELGITPPMMLEHLQIDSVTKFKAEDAEVLRTWYDRVRAEFIREDKEPT